MVNVYNLKKWLLEFHLVKIFHNQTYPPGSKALNASASEIFSSCTP